MLAEDASHFFSSGTYEPLPTLDTGLAAQWSLSHTVGICRDRFHLSRGRGDAVSARRHVAEYTDESRNRYANVDSPAERARGNGGWQRLTITITPDDPSTAVDDSAFSAASLGFEVACANDGTTPCGMSFLPGHSVYVGLGPADPSGTNEVSVDQPSIERPRQMGLCGP